MTATTTTALLVLRTEADVDLASNVLFRSCARHVAPGAFSQLLLAAPPPQHRALRAALQASWPEALRPALAVRLLRLGVAQQKQRDTSVAARLALDWASRSDAGWLLVLTPHTFVKARLDAAGLAAALVAGQTTAESGAAELSSALEAAHALCADDEACVGRLARRLGERRVPGAPEQRLRVGSPQGPWMLCAAAVRAVAQRCGADALLHACEAGSSLATVAALLAADGSEALCPEEATRSQPLVSPVSPRSLGELLAFDAAALAADASPLAFLSDGSRAGVGPRTAFALLRATPALQCPWNVASCPAVTMVCAIPADLPAARAHTAVLCAVASLRRQIYPAVRLSLLLTGQVLGGSVAQAVAGDAALGRRVRTRPGELYAMHEAVAHAATLVVAVCAANDGSMPVRVSAQVHALDHRVQAVLLRRHLSADVASGRYRLGAAHDAGSLRSLLGARLVVRALLRGEEVDAGVARVLDERDATLLVASIGVLPERAAAAVRAEDSSSEDDEDYSDFELHEWAEEQALGRAFPGDASPTLSQRLAQIMEEPLERLEQERAAWREKPPEEDSGGGLSSMQIGLIVLASLFIVGALIAVIVFLVRWSKPAAL